MAASGHVRLAEDIPLSDQSLPPNIAVVALDFGTSFSGYAFSFISNPDNIIMFKNWGSNLGINCSFKTPTCLLLNPKNELDSFGFDAQEKLSRLIDDGQDEGYEFFDGIKMKLYDDKKLSRDTTCLSHKNKEYPILSLITLTFQFLKERVLKDIDSKRGCMLQARDLRWVLTVPAIWGETAKELMLEAAEKAGLLDERDASNVLLALEPEAASVHCKRSDVKCVGRSESSDFKMDVGTKYLVVDVGGGTLDMTAEEILPGNEVDVLCSANGGPIAGNRVNQNILELLSDILGAAVMRKYQRECFSDYLDLQSKIENKKKVVGTNDSHTVNISISHQLASTCEELHGKKCELCISDAMKEKGASFKSGVLRIPHALVLNAFKDVTDYVISNVEDLLSKKELEGLKYIIMVGGFSESPILQEKMRGKFSDRYSVITPSDAATAVLQGAVLYGHNPSVVRSRRALKTYAVEMWPIFEEGKHPEDRKTKSDDGTYLVKGGLYILVKKGDIVYRDSEHSYIVTPVYATQPSIPVKLYSSNKKEPRYVDESDVKSVANCTVELKGTGMKREALVTFKFGGTRVEVKGSDPTNGKVARTTFTFLTK